MQTPRSNSPSTTRLRGDVLLVPGAGHYPQAEAPDVVAPAVVRFLRVVFPGS